METGFLEESVSNYKGSTQYFRSLDPHSYRNLIQNIVGPLLLYLCHTPGVRGVAPHSAQVRSEPRPPPPGTRATCVLLQFGNQNVVSCANQLKYLGVRVISA